MKLRLLLNLIQIIFEWKVSINQKVKAKPFRYLGALRVNETKSKAENACNYCYYYYHCYYYQ